jgi:hypothetical protein
MSTEQLRARLRYLRHAALPDKDSVELLDEAIEALAVLEAQPVNVQCDICGALVLDRDLHIKWHRRLDKVESSAFSYDDPHTMGHRRT